MRMRVYWLAAAAAVVLSAGPALAQQPAPEGQQPDDVPTFTNDDVPEPVVEPAPEAPPEEVVDDPNLTPEERADAARKAADKKAAPAPAAAPGQEGPSPEELAWRNRYAAASAAASAAERAAQEAEIRVTELRNQLSQPGSADDRNSLADEIERQGQAAREARAVADRAKADLAAVESEGRARRFQPDPGPSRTTRGGQPNAEYYRKQYADAANKVADAERRITLYQYRVNDLRGRILNNSGSGDQFTQLPIQTELNEALDALEKAKTDYDAAQVAVEAAKREAAGAGVPVGP